MYAELEPLSFVLRIWSDGQHYGDPYDWCATVVRIAPDTLEVLGAMRAPTPAEWRAINDAAFMAGYKRVVFCRADGRQREIKLRNRANVQ